MNVGEVSEKEDVDSHRYNYLDNDGFISPVEDSGKENEMTHLGCDECATALVEGNCFVISSEFHRRQMCI